MTRPDELNDAALDKVSAAGKMEPLIYRMPKRSELSVGSKNDLLAYREEFGVEVEKDDLVSKGKKVSLGRSNPGVQVF